MLSNLESFKNRKELMKSGVVKAILGKSDKEGRVRLMKRLRTAGANALRLESGIGETWGKE